MSTLRTSQRTESRDSLGRLGIGLASNAAGSGGNTTKRAGVMVQRSSSGSRIDASDRMRGRGNGAGLDGSDGGLDGSGGGTARGIVGAPARARIVDDRRKVVGTSSSAEASTRRPR